MANELFSAWLFGGYQCLDPKEVAAGCAEAEGRLPGWYLAGEANGYRCPLGAAPGTGAVLLRASDYQRLAAGEAYSLIANGGTDPLVVQRLFVTGAEEVAKGYAGDPAGVWLVRFADVRQTFTNIPINKRYNVRFQIGVNGWSSLNFYLDSTNGGTAWTWTEMVGDLWGLISGLGAFPGLPFTPNGTPNNFDFRPVGYAWQSLNSLLLRLGCAVRYDPIKDNFSVVRIGDTDTRLTDYRDVYESQIIEDVTPYESPHVYLPAQVRVRFNRLQVSRGTEPEIPASGNYTENAYYDVDVSPVSPYPAKVAGSVAVVWDDLPALWSIDNANPDNISDLYDRAAERADDWYRMMTDGDAWGQNRRVTTYAGILPDFIPGEKCKLVEWIDNGDVVTTRVHQGAGLLGQSDGTGRPVLQQMQPAAFARPTLPAYPEVVQIIRATNDTATADGNYDAEWLIVDPSTMPPTVLSRADVILRLADSVSAYAVKVGHTWADARLIGRGTDSSLGTRPMFLATPRSDGAVGQALTVEDSTGSTVCSNVAKIKLGSSRLTLACSGPSDARIATIDISDDCCTTTTTTTTPPPCPLFPATDYTVAGLPIDCAGCNSTGTVGDGVWAFACGTQDNSGTPFGDGLNHWYAYCVESPQIVFYWPTGYAECCPIGNPPVGADWTPYGNPGAPCDPASGTMITA